MAGNLTRARSSNRLTAWHLLLLVPYVAVLWVPFYNRIEPSAFGIPFFYLYQIAWVVISSMMIAVVYLATRPR
jgi:hypothetical protein